MQASFEDDWRQKLQNLQSENLLAKIIILGRISKMCAEKLLIDLKKDRRHVYSKRN